MRWGVLLIAIGLAGCASTGVVSTGADTYMVARKSPQVGFGDATALKGEVLTEANEFCAKQGKRAERISMSSEPSGLARSASAELEFRCID